MPQRADEPLEKITLNLFASDVLWLREVIGYGWSDSVRKVVREWRQKYDQELGHE